jgi:hypothetical protein
MENNIREKLSNTTKHEFFVILAQVIGYSPIDVIEYNDKITLLSDNGKLKVLYKEHERIVNFDDYIEEYGTSLFNDFNENKLQIMTHNKLD